MSDILLVEPLSPKPAKSSRKPIPLGLLKFATLHRRLGNRVQLVRGQKLVDYRPHEVLITSYFTYWSRYVWDAVAFYKSAYPKAKITVGGIYASLMPDHCKESGCDEVFVGLHPEAELCPPAYDLVDEGYQIVHTSRGCFRRCDFCGVWRIEPETTYKHSILHEIRNTNIVFYDNNLLANPHIEGILAELSHARYQGRKVRCECQCGLDGRLLTPRLAELLKAARFRYPRIAWDGPYSNRQDVAQQIDILAQAGFERADIHVFMLYNHDIAFGEMEKKRRSCQEWGVQVADCRYRPLDQTVDNYKHWCAPNKQGPNDYYIHPLWTDALIRLFRRNVREHNICIRHGFARYSRELELQARREARKSRDW